MKFEQGMKLYSKMTNFEVILGEPSEIDGQIYFPVVYDDFSAGIESERMLAIYYKENE
jgi:hypothetical protein